MPALRRNFTAILQHKKVIKQAEIFHGSVIVIKVAIGSFNILVPGGIVFYMGNRVSVLKGGGAQVLQQPLLLADFYAVVNISISIGSCAGCICPCSKGTVIAVSRAGAVGGKSPGIIFFARHKGPEQPLVSAHAAANKQAVVAQRRIGLRAPANPFGRNRGAAAADEI